MKTRYMVQNDKMKPFYDWCYVCSFATLEDARKFIEKEKRFYSKINSKVEYRIIKETTEVMEY